MPVESIGVEDTSATTASNASLGQEDLFKILLTELSFQDPLDPMDNKEFIAQLAQFTSLEQTRLFNENLESLLTVQAADQSIVLLGKTVEINTSSSLEVGEVIAVNFDNGSPVMTIEKADGSFIGDIKLSQINSVK